MVSEPPRAWKIDFYIHSLNRATRVEGGKSKAVSFPKDILLNNASLGPYEEDFEKDKTILLVHFADPTNTAGDLVTGVICGLCNGSVSKFARVSRDINLCHT